MVGGEIADAGEVLDGVVVVALFDQVSRGLVVEAGENQDDAGEHDVHGRWDDPALCGVEVEVERRTPGCEIGQHDTNVDCAGEDTSAETTDRLGGNLGDVDRSNDGGFANTDAGNETPRVDLAETSIVGEEDDNTEDPEDAQLTSSPETTDSVGDQEGEESTSNGTDLDHGRDVALDVGVADLVKLVEAELFLEALGVKGTRDQTFVNTSSGAHDAETEDGKPQTPVEDLLWVIAPVELEDVDGFLASRHDETKDYGRA